MWGIVRVILSGIAAVVVVGVVGDAALVPAVFLYFVHVSCEMRADLCE